MLLLVLADRHMGRVVEQNVGGHQVRIDIEPGRRLLAVLAGLLLELGHAVEPAEARHAIEDPGELGMAGDLALVEDDVLLRIDAGGDEGRRHLAGVLGQLVGVLQHGDGVQIDHAIEALMLGLERHEFGDGAEIIAEMQVAGRLHAREDAGLGLGLLHALAPVRRAGYGVGDAPAQALPARVQPQAGFHLADLLGDGDGALGHGEMQPLDHAALDHDHALLLVLRLAEGVDHLARPLDLLARRREDLVAGPDLVGWISVLPSMPSVRPRSHSSRKPSSSLKSL